MVHKYSVTFFVVFLSIFASSLNFASTPPSFSYFSKKFNSNRTVIAVNTGTVFTSPGSSQTLPAGNAYQSFAFYSDKSAHQRRAILGAFVGKEWLFLPAWVLQVGLSYSQTDIFKAKGLLMQGLDNQSADIFSYQYKILHRQIIAESKLFYPCKKYFYPFAYLGLGVALNKAFHYSTTVPPFLTFTRNYPANTQASLTYRAGAGLDIVLADNLRLGFSYYWADLGSIRLTHANIDHVQISGRLTQDHWYAQEAMLQLTRLV